MEIRTGLAADADAIAALHTESWRTAYAGIMPEAYLEGPLPATHRNLWKARAESEPYLNGGDPPCLLVAEDEAGIGAFAYLVPERDGRVLVDNLHVRPTLKRSGLGSRLMGLGLGWAAEHHPGKTVYLEVLRDNAPARAFYERMGGRPGKEFVERFHAGFDLDVMEYTWSPLTGR
ncbi:GNAT family N-acetyltransferase [Nonomuraea sp. SBT364]|uniref:GNAT family N-acetyltransferase n=1 Tax=Nonomuraea sp. SBT364 TaxID=1580530 RepID=UPI00066C927A|nr:GNAT family N-acetyltransferase [Nonomuraea sp. SBT364]